MGEGLRGSEGDEEGEVKAKEGQERSGETPEYHGCLFDSQDTLGLFEDLMSSIEQND